MTRGGRRSQRLQKSTRMKSGITIITTITITISSLFGNLGGIEDMSSEHGEADKTSDYGKSTTMSHDTH